VVVSAPTTSAVPPDFLGTEPEHGWCYYFEKAELAAGSQDWQQVMKVGEEAISKGFSPAVPSEWVVFIQGYALGGDWQQATDLTRQAIQADPEIDRPLCTTWGLIERQMGADPEGDKARREMFSLLGCK
jgi:hypothetical protein